MIIVESSIITPLLEVVPVSIPIKYVCGIFHVSLYKTFDDFRRCVVIAVPFRHIVRRGLYLRQGVGNCHTDTRPLNHGQIIGVIPRRDDLIRRNAQQRHQPLQAVPLADILSHNIGTVILGGCKTQRKCLLRNPFANRHPIRRGHEALHGLPGRLRQPVIAHRRSA